MPGCVVSQIEYSGAGEGRGGGGGGGSASVLIDVHMFTSSYHM